MSLSFKIKNAFLGKNGLIRKNMFLGKTVSFLLANQYYRSKRDVFELAFAGFLPEEKRKDKKYMRFLKKDILLARIRYYGTPEEYFRYDFEKLSDAGRREYILEHENFYIFRGIADKETLAIVNNKYLAYKKFEPYYKREVITLKSEADKEIFADFVSRHEKFIVKPLAAYGGHGIFLDSANGSDVEEKFKKLLSIGETVIEELLIQDPRMAAYNPSSINTMRVITYTENGNMKVIETSLRIGCGNSVVDNGCLSCAVDYETGTVITRARMAHSRGFYVFHPDTGLQILGSKVPCWDELKALLPELVKVCPAQKLIGWDLALCKDGWTIVEVNAAPEIQILAGEGMGMRKAVEETVLKKS